MGGKDVNKSKNQELNKYKQIDIDSKDCQIFWSDLIKRK